MGETPLLVSPISFIIPGMVRQVGIFFILVGLFLLIIFGVAESKGSETIPFLCYGAPLTVLGLYLWYKNRVPTPADRFRAYRRWRSRAKK